MEAVVQDGGGQSLSRSRRVLCRLDEIDDPGGKGFAQDDGPDFFVIRRGEAVWGYVNVCPHQGVNLDWKPDSFLTVDKTLIQCATHGAQFVIETGECIAGPCPGRRLTPIVVVVEDGNVELG